ncbi:hypothetical protein FRC11_015059, partial [Ceratobasidium sp. 423]
MASGASNGNFIPQALSTPGPARSCSHPFTPSLPPCRKLSQAPAITQDSHTSCRVLSQSLSTPPTPAAISPCGLVPTPPTTCKPTSMVPNSAARASATSTPQAPNWSSSSLSEELPAKFIAQCALLPVNVLAMFSPVIQVAVAIFRASTTTSKSIVPPTTTATTPAPTQMSDVPSASESNLPINPKQSSALQSSASKPPSKQKTTKSAISKSTGKKMQAKTAPPIVEDDEPVPEAPVQQAVTKSRGGKGKAATKANGTGQTMPDEETPIGVAAGAGVGRKVVKAVKAAKATSTGAKGGAGGKATVGKIDGGGAGSSKLTEPPGLDHFSVPKKAALELEGSPHNSHSEWLLDCIQPLRAIAVSQREALLLAGGKTPKAKEAVKEVLDILNNDQFWMDTAHTVLHLAPLAITSHITQAASTQLDHVLLTLARMYQVYSSMAPTEADTCKAICLFIEKRWAACNQDIHILAVFLNPFVWANLFPKSNIDFNPA